MEHEFIAILTVLKAITVLLGIVFLTIAFRAYRKHRTRAMLVLQLAIALMTLAAIAEGFVFQFLGLSLDASHIIEAVFTLAAFMVLVFSVLVRERRDHVIERLSQAGEYDDEG